MKSVSVFLTVLALSFVCFESSAFDSTRPYEEVAVEINDQAFLLGEALEAPNYVAARETMDVLFDLFKEEIKLTKKVIHDLERNDEEDRAAQMQESLDRKEEIHEQLHAMLDSSRAGLRAKATQVQVLVDEYVSLLTTSQEELISSNN